VAMATYQPSPYEITGLSAAIVKKPYAFIGRTRHLQEHCFLIGSWPWCCWRSPVGPRAGGFAEIANPGCREELTGDTARQGTIAEHHSELREYHPPLPVAAAWQA
jgi:hypothetical protein